MRSFKTVTKEYINEHLCVTASSVIKFIDQRRLLTEIYDPLLD